MNTKRLAIFCVNYNSYSELYDYIKSIEVASSNAKYISVDVFVIDNTDKDFQKIEYCPRNINFTVFDYHENLGYFGAVCKAIKEVNLDAYDYYVISNVDVRLDKNSLSELSQKQYSRNIGIIAPEIFSINEKRFRNPGRVERYSRKKLEQIRFMFAHPNLFYLYSKFIYKYKTTKNDIRTPMQNIYLAHGSFIILTKEFYLRCGLINYPVFLYCEEVYLAELCRQHDLITIYDPSVKVTDIDHVSTGKLHLKRFCKYNYDALSYILDNFFKD